MIIEEWLKFIVLLPLIGATVYYFGKLSQSAGPNDNEELAKLGGFMFSFFYIIIPFLLLVAISKYTMPHGYNNNRFTFLVSMCILQIILISFLASYLLPIIKDRVLGAYHAQEKKAIKKMNIRKGILWFYSLIILYPLSILLLEPSPNYIFLSFEILTTGVGLSIIALSAGIINAIYLPVKIVFRDGEVLEGIHVKSGKEVVVWKVDGEIVYNYRINPSEVKYIQTSELLSNMPSTKKEAKT